MRRWFVYGLYALYQYWLSYYSSLLGFIMYFSQSLKSDNDAKRFAIYLWMSVMGCHLRLSCRFKVKIIFNDSG